MLDDIRFAAPAVAKKAYVEDLTHFRIKGGRITGFDGRMTLSSEIGVDLDVRPNAAKFLAAVRACEGAIALHVTPAGKLSVKAGKFKVFVDCLADDGAFESQPEGETVLLGDNFMRGLKSLSPAIGVDASRPWAMGIKVHGESMYATNNTIFAQYWHGSSFPLDVVIPGRAIDEILRIGTPPTKVQLCDHSVTFWFDEKRWLKTTLLDGTAWPLEKIAGLMDDTGTAGQQPFPPGMFDSIAALKPFLADDSGLYLRPNLISTAREDGEGASFEIALDNAPELQCYSFQQLEILGQVATAINWQNYPKPCMFTHANEPLRGLIVGRHL